MGILDISTAGRTGTQVITEVVPTCFPGELLFQTKAVVNETLTQLRCHGMGKADYCTDVCVAIGYFNLAGEPKIRNAMIPDGRNVEVRHVDEGDSGCFEALLRSVAGKTLRDQVLTNCSPAMIKGNPNFHLCERCYAYLQS